MRFLILIVLTWSGIAFGFDYLEHSFFTDKACYEAQLELAKQLNTSESKAKYLALALYCPANWEKDYCSDDYKLAQGHVNLLESPPQESGDHSLTLGDISALPDHTDHFGRIKGLPTAKREGLMSQVLDWLAEAEGEADGLIADIAEDACETDELTSWPQIHSNLERSKTQKLFEEYFKVAARAEIQQGPSDPAGAYSFDNPQYLDMVLKNHHHFGKQAYQTWLGLHQAAIDLSQKSCENLLIHEEYNCDDFYAFLKHRLVHWSKNAAPELVVPIRSIVANLDTKILQQTFSAFVGLTFEGLGLHFLQDNMAGGHIRTNREALNLEDARYYHDMDGKNGLLAQFTTASGRTNFLAYGDGHLLGKGAGMASPCPPNQARSPEEITNCLLQYHQGLLLQATRDSLLHFASSGKNHGQFLPSQSVARPGENSGKPPQTLEKGTLPLPRPDFSYQSVALATAINNQGSVLQNGVNLSFLSSLGDDAGWLTSFNYGLHISHGDLNTQDFRQFHGEFSFGFHWRWAARFLINAAPYLQVARTKERNHRLTSIGLGPRIGMTLLPEGWIRLPLEITFSWKLPFSVYESKDFNLRNQQWFAISIGLAFM